MKHYQDNDPLHGNGKAMPHPKRPTQHTYRGGGENMSVERTTFADARDKDRKKKKGRETIYGIIKNILFPTRAARSR